MMDFKVRLINPPLVFHSGDIYGSIPFMPTGLLYLAGYLESKGVDVSILDGFGLSPHHFFKIDKELVGNGLTEKEILERVHGDEKLIGISVNSAMIHSIALRLAKMIKKLYPEIILVVGGSHASIVYKEFLEGGFDYVCIGEAEKSLFSLVRYLQSGQGSPSDIPGLACKGSEPSSCAFETNLDDLAFAALHMLPLDNYWSLRMQYAPVKGRFMVISTSRGCVYNCRFCTTPILHGGKWRTRSAKNIVDEIQAAVETYGIEDVILQDELFGFRKDTARAFANEIINRNLKIRLFLPTGIKFETTDEETLALLKQAGLCYLVFAPESGSQRILQKMNKPIDFEKLFCLVSFVKNIGIKLGCFFIIGFEDENRDDRQMTKELVVKLTKMGVDEISLFIWSPLPGSIAFKNKTGWSRYEDLNWSPYWRKNYILLNRFRNKLYVIWLTYKILYHPIKSLKVMWNILTFNFELKSEMAFVRLLSSHIFPNWRLKFQPTAIEDTNKAA